MIYIQYKKTTGRSEMVHYMPFDEEHGFHKTEAELLETGILVGTLDEPEQKEGFIATLYVDTETKVPYYKYEEAPVDPATQDDQRIAKLEEQLEQQQEVINFMLLGGE